MAIFLLISLVIIFITGSVAAVAEHFVLAMVCFSVIIFAWGFAVGHGYGRDEGLTESAHNQQKPKKPKWFDKYL